MNDNQIVKYCLFPGTIQSSNDGQEHYIGPHQLAHLYGVKMRECIIAKETEPAPPDLIHLYPRYNGDYRLPGELLLDRRRLDKCPACGYPGLYLEWKAVGLVKIQRNQITDRYGHTDVSSGGISCQRCGKVVVTSAEIPEAAMNAILGEDES